MMPMRAGLFLNSKPSKWSASLRGDRQAFRDVSYMHFAVPLFDAESLEVAEEVWAFEG
jgi:hypothetical protein